MAARCGIAALAFATALLIAAPAAGAPSRLEYRGSTLTRREVEGLASRALERRGDSTAVAALLGQIVARLQDQGYLDARAAADWDTSGAGTLTLQVREGVRFRWGSVGIETPGSADSAVFARALPIAAGGTASPAAAATAVERSLAAAVDEGYAYARLGISRLEPAGEEGLMTLRLAGVLGPRVQLSGVRVEGLRITRPALIRRTVGRLEDRPFRPALAEDGRQRLAQLGLFRSVRYEGLEGGADWSRARLVYRVEEPRYSRFEAAAGFQGDAGAAGLVRLDLDNLLGTGRAAALRWESRGHGRSDFEARYVEPLLFGQPLRLEGTVRQLVEDTLYTDTHWAVRARWTLGAQEHLEAGYERDAAAQDAGELRQAHVQSTTFGFERAALDDPLAPRRGTWARLVAGGSFKREQLRPEGSRTARLSSGEARFEWHRPLRRESGLTLELRAAGRFSSARVLRVFERQLVGGASSLRGYDEGRFRADRYALSRLEWRFFLGTGGQRAFLFWDHAWLAVREPLSGGSTPLRTSHHDGLGAGLRLQAAGGLVGVDYGLEPGRPFIEGRIHLQLISTF